MTTSENPADDLTKKARHEKLEAIIRDRLGLGEDWFGITSRPRFFDEMTKSRLTAFEDVFGQMIKLGCKWEILLTCITCYNTYNSRRRVVRPARYDSEGELSHLPEKDWEPDAAPRPPGRDGRNRIATNLSAAAGEIENHEDLLCTLGRLDAPPQTEWTDPTTDGDMRDVRITADEAVLYVQKLLRWCRKLLSDDSIGNFSTVESVGQLVPCVYVEVVAPRAKSGKGQRLPLQNVADLLNAVPPHSHHSQGQLRIALDRFMNEYPRLHRELLVKIEDLHRKANEHADGWRQLFGTEDRRRRSR
jgi:hypothetical protein